MIEKEFFRLFPKKKAIIGMVHVKALPGTPLYEPNDGFKGIVNSALDDAKRLIESGVDGIQIENQWDRPFLKDKMIGVETVSFLTHIATLIAQLSPIPLGMNVHLNGCKQALAIAKASGCSWIRAFQLTNSYISNSGYVEASAPDLMRYRKEIDAQDVLIFGDFQVKHGSHAITSDRSVLEKAHDIEEALAHAAIITGAATGNPPDEKLCKQVQNYLNIPLLIGSGLSYENIDQLWPYVDGAIIGSSFKIDGDIRRAISVERVKTFIQRAREIEGV